MNPLGMTGLAFVEFATPEPASLRGIFFALGFSRTQRDRTSALELFQQNDIRCFVQSDPRSFAARFSELHGPSVSAVGFAFHDARAAYEEAVRRGARPFVPEANAVASFDVPAVHGIGDSLVYFVDARASWRHRLVALDAPEFVTSHGFSTIDHLTNNVAKGALRGVSDFYESVFGFRPVRSFDIDGKKSGLYSYALRAPCGTFCIPINEDKGTAGQIAEYLREYRGAGVQHIAFLTNDILASLDGMKGRVATLDIDAAYYAEAFDRVRNVREDRERIRTHHVLVDGDDGGYLLQVFTKNLIGPIFFELIQRENHHSFGEGNFSALFRSIERDQERRGVL